MIVLDAIILIAHFEDRDSHHERATELLTRLAGEPMGASPITLAELLVGPARHRQLSRASAALKRLDVVTIALSDDAPVRLAELRATTGLKMPDCCVIVAAEQTNGAVATFDDRLARAAHDRGLTVHS